ncbi:MAG: hypothetical protein L0Z50_38725 [Verrucomicrobiales bacterium]|nr:hypothetical protein [Verrucomicrobiales bacterium]
MILKMIKLIEGQSVGHGFVTISEFPRPLEIVSYSDAHDLLRPGIEVRNYSAFLKTFPFVAAHQYAEMVRTDEPD